MCEICKAQIYLYIRLHDVVQYEDSKKLKSQEYEIFIDEDIYFQ